jgi:hypothetical protein
MCVCEVHAAPSQSINIWSFHLWMIEWMQDPIIEIITNNEQYIHLFHRFAHWTLPAKILSVTNLKDHFQMDLMLSLSQ